ncbi:hypothetical protein L211DRAFT_334534 [Terfezia boudieri ATCC MYA-4762]|uniref:Uncharacterized protein n=1 Tax=Terfezia boudieri ATCC MYA-4762 TaxID=1051890 RepID=A0A3N4LKT3_9PEZI|nr:hypothetical protein L211DRAFT_334534 [Terfezia boudieri ATCC MYA-4762]
MSLGCSSATLQWAGFYLFVYLLLRTTRVKLLTSRILKWLRLWDNFLMVYGAIALLSAALHYFPQPTERWVEECLPWQARL